MEPVNIAYDSYLITTDKSLMHIADIHKWLSEEAYWCKNIPVDKVQTAFDNSFCIGAVCDGRQVAFARLVTDYTTFGYLADVYVEDAHRGRGISKKMMEVLFGLQWVKELRGIKLQTMDAHGLYRKYGFTDCKFPERIMEISRGAGIYNPLP